VANVFILHQPRGLHDFRSSFAFFTIIITNKSFDIICIVIIFFWDAYFVDF